MRKYLVMLAAVQTLLTGYNPPRLQVREESSHPAVLKSESEGIKDLQQLVQESETEEAWAYVPTVQEWHDIGKNSSFVEGQSVSVALDVLKIRELVGKYSQVSIYHIHPRLAILKLLNSPLNNPPNEEKNNPPKNPAKKPTVRTAMLNAVIPSPDDLSSAILLSCTADPYYEHRHLVASPFGVTDYSLRKEAIKKYCERESSLPYLYLEASILAHGILGKADINNIERKIQRAQKNNQPTVILKDQLVNIKFTPYSALKQ